MNISDRILRLRKSRGISQEELADKTGVSRQAVSKRESGQSIPDTEKIILLSDYFETTTDFLLKGIEPAQECETKCSALLFALSGTIVNAIGLVLSAVIWIERQTVFAVGAGLIIMLLGTGIFLTGQFMNTKEKRKAKDLFLLPDVWILSFIPLSCCFNLLDGFPGGFSGQLAPLPNLGNSYLTYGFYWITCFSFCIAADVFIIKKNANEKGQLCHHDAKRRAGNQS